LFCAPMIPDSHAPIIAFAFGSHGRQVSPSKTKLFLLLLVVF